MGGACLSHRGATVFGHVGKFWAGAVKEPSHACCVHVVAEIRCSAPLKGRVPREISTSVSSLPSNPDFKFTDDVTSLPSN